MEKTIILVWQAKSTKIGEPPYFMLSLPLRDALSLLVKSRERVYSLYMSHTDTIQKSLTIPSL